MESWSGETFEKATRPEVECAAILVHLAQTELALSTRARFALTQPGYTAQAFSQDDWMPIDAAPCTHGARRIHGAAWTES